MASQITESKSSSDADTSHELVERIPMGLDEADFRRYAADLNSPGIWSAGRYSPVDIDRVWWWYGLCGRNAEAVQS